MERLSPPKTLDPVESACAGRPACLRRRSSFLQRLFRKAGQILHVAVGAAEAENFLVDIHLLVQQAAGVDVEFDCPALQTLDDLRLDLWFGDRREDLRRHTDRRHAGFDFFEPVLLLRLDFFRRSPSVDTRSSSGIDQLAPGLIGCLSAGGKGIVNSPIPGLNSGWLFVRSKMRPCGSIFTVASTLPTDAATLANSGGGFLSVALS